MVARVLALMLAALAARGSVWSVTNDVAGIATASVSAAAGEVRVTVAARAGGLALDLSNATSEWAIVDARDGETVTNAPGRILDAAAGVVRFSAALPVGSFRAIATVYPAVDPAYQIDATTLTVTSALPFTVVGIAPVTNFDVSAITSGTLATGRLPTITSNMIDPTTDAAYRGGGSGGGITQLIASASSAGVATQASAQVWTVGTALQSRVFFYLDDPRLTNTVVIPIPSNSAAQGIRITGLFGMTNGNESSGNLSFVLNGDAGSATNARNHYGMIYLQGSSVFGTADSNGLAGAYIDSVTANSAVTGSAVSVDTEIRFIRDPLPRKPWKASTFWFFRDSSAGNVQRIAQNSGISTVAGPITQITFTSSRPWTNALWLGEYVQ